MPINYSYIKRVCVAFVMLARNVYYKGKFFVFEGDEGSNNVVKQKHKNNKDNDNNSSIAKQT